MLAKLLTYDHPSNGLSLFIVPETDAERDLLRGLWRHGELKNCNGVADGSEQGFCVAWRLERKEAT